MGSISSEDSKMNKKSRLVSGMGLGLQILSEMTRLAQELGVSEEELHILATQKGISHLRKMIAGLKTHIIDCDVNPFVPHRWMIVEEHQKGGMFEWNANNVKLQRINGRDFSKESAQSVLNANVLDYLFANEHLIPAKWKCDKDIFFCGTIYRNTSDTSLCVRCLRWYDGKWCLGYNAIGHSWRGDFFAVLGTS